MRFGLAGIVAVALASCTPMPVADPPSRAAAVPAAMPAMRSLPAARPGGPTRANADMARDFLDLAFRMESGRALERMTRFEGPIGVRVTGPVPPSLVADLRALVARLREEAGIDIFLTGADEAEITVEAVSRSDLTGAVPAAACFVVPRLSSWDEFLANRRSGLVDWTTLERRERAAVFIPADVPPQEIRDCLHEEIAQALGPLNDLYRLPDSVFNDDNIHAVLTGFDMLVLRAYYDPSMPSGTTRDEAAARLPGLFARLNPAGERAGPALEPETGRDWVDAIETALASDASETSRRVAAARAVALADRNGWTGARRGFAYYALGRLETGSDPDRALAAFREAARAFRQTDETRLHEAHVAVQLAAFALRSGDAEAVLRLVDQAVPLATRHQNAALLATLLMFRAEALELQGREDAAAAVRVDSLAYARYGFGSAALVRARATEVAGLSPAGRS